MSRGTALTTGANSGIGLATTIELARKGFRSIGTVRSRLHRARLQLRKLIPARSDQGSAL